MLLASYCSQLKDKMDRFRTQSLFWETNTSSMPPLFSLKDHNHVVDGITYPSLKVIFLGFDDPTEYEFAVATFGSWPHWQRICRNKQLMEIIEPWRTELAVKLTSRAIQDIAKQSKKGSVQASTWLAKRGWEEKRGRPTKIEVERERKIAANISAELADDLDRLGIARH